MCVYLVHDFKPSFDTFHKLNVNHFFFCWLSFIAQILIETYEKRYVPIIDGKTFQVVKYLSSKTIDEFLFAKRSHHRFRNYLSNDGSWTNIVRRWKANRRSHKRKAMFLIDMYVYFSNKKTAADFYSIRTFSARDCRMIIFKLKRRGLLSRSAFLRHKKKSAQNDTCRTNISIRQAHAKDTRMSKSIPMKTNANL